MSVSIDMSGKIVLITGIDNGDGKEIAVQMAKAGADIAGTYAGGSEKVAEDCKKEVEAAGCRCLMVKAEPGVIEDMKVVADSVKEFYGKLDVVLHNIRNYQTGEIKSLTVEDWEKAHRTIVEAPIFLTQYVLPMLQEAEECGRILFIADEDYYSSDPKLVSYANAQGSFIKAMQTLAVDCKPNVLTNAVIANRKNDKEFVDADGRKWSPCTVEDLAQMLMYLSVCVPTMNGSTIPMDGGYGLTHYRTL